MAVRLSLAPIRSTRSISVLSTISISKCNPKLPFLRVTRNPKLLRVTCSSSASDDHDLPAKLMCSSSDDLLKPVPAKLEGSIKLAVGNHSLQYFYEYTVDNPPRFFDRLFPYCACIPDLKVKLGIGCLLVLVLILYRFCADANEEKFRSQKEKVAKLFEKLKTYVDDNKIPKEEFDEMFDSVMDDANKNNEK